MEQAPLHPPYRLQQVQIPLEARGACEEGYKNYLHASANEKVIPEDMLCAGSLGRGPCMVRTSGSALPQGAPPGLDLSRLDEESCCTKSHEMCDCVLSLQGDSGGPLVCRKGGSWVQAGVVSWGIGCSMIELPAVFTSVQSHVAWIRQQIRKCG
ncbi:hypothetical protein P7K49_022696 [Saguinus oedipus]|uniref:Peptidase S1 domain-containing protein n=1 Tax=Saguinus oedipus TaxID=9490 RepID=A0ABQ9UKD3_SAGOE|nr:hypothetical protein P7K49_022696 [Saguinus oedipus]